MADFEGMAKALQIPQDVLNNLDKVNDKIKEIEGNSERRATAFMGAMNGMNNGAGALVDRLNKILSLMNSMGSMSSGGMNNLANGMGNAATEGERMASALSGAATAVNQFGASGMNIAELRKAIKDINDELRKGEGVRPFADQQYLVDYRRQLEQELKEQEKANAEREAEHRKMLERMQREEEKAAQRRARIDSRMRRTNYQDYVTSTEGSLRTADRATNYNQRAQAIRNLEAAMRRLNVADANYYQDLQRLSEAHRRLATQQQDFTRRLQLTENQQSKLMNTSQQLARQLALLFSVSAIKGYIRKLIQVRGEFELQQTALASILDNQQQANRLFSQVTELAIQSPFTIRQLTTYTKSLSAYQVEYENLYGTLKMLADVSSGLGVDMERLILAFGQVKAANFLRGTETRQFTEAGVNMLGELSKYYTELEGRMVSVAEVQDRQFRRMISFQDVEAVFQRLTSAGGMFYNMQERQAETLLGVWSNLQDKVDLMLNDIGQANDGLLKGVVQFVGFLTENYNVLVDLLIAGGAAFLMNKVRMLEMGEGMVRVARYIGIVNNAFARQLTFIQLLRVGWVRLTRAISGSGKAFTTFLKGNWVMVALAALAAAVIGLVRAFNETKEQLDDVRKRSDDLYIEVVKLSLAFDKATESAKAHGKTITENSSAYKEQYKALQDLNEILQERGYELPIRMELITPENIEEAFNAGEQLLQLGNQFRTEIESALVSNNREWFGNNLNVDMEQLSRSYSEVIQGSTYSRIKDVIAEIAEMSDSLPGSTQKYVKELQRARGELESEFDYLQRQVEAIVSINALTNGRLRSAKYLNEVWDDMAKVSSREKEVAEGIAEALQDVIDKYGDVDRLKDRYQNNTQLFLTEMGNAIDNFASTMNTTITDEVKRLATELMAETLEIPVKVVQRPDVPTIFNDWRDIVKDIDTEGLIDDTMLQSSDLVKFAQQARSAYKDAKEAAEQYSETISVSIDHTERLNEITKELGYTPQLGATVAGNENAMALEAEYFGLLDNEDKINEKLKEEKKNAEALRDVLIEVARALNIDLNKSDKGGKKKDPRIETLNELLRLIDEAVKRYRALEKEFSEPQSLKIVQEEYANSKIGDVVATMSFDTDGIVAGIEAVVDKVAAGAPEALQKELEDLGNNKIRNIKIEGEIEARVTNREDLKTQIDDMLEQASFSQKLLEDGISPDIVKRVFDTDIINIDTLKKEIEKLEPMFRKQGLNWEEVWEDTEKRISEMERKSLEERMQRYAKYLQDSVSKRVQIEVQAAKDIDAVQRETKYTDTEKASLTAAIRGNADREISKVNLEEFQSSDVYMQMFMDLENVSTAVLNNLKAKLDDLRNSMANLTPEQLKTINEYYSDLDKEIISRNPFKSLVASLREVNELTSQGRSEDAITQEMLGLQSMNELLNQEISDREYIIRLKEEGIALDAENDAILARNPELLKLSTDELRNQINAKKTQVKENDLQIGVDNEQLDSFTNARKSLAQVSSEMDSLKSIAKSAFNAITSITESMGEEASEESKAWADLGGNVLDLVAQMVMFGLQLKLNTALATILGKEISAALGPIGWAVMALQAIAMIFTAVSQIHDARLQDQIEQEEDKVSALEEAYKDLERAMDKAFSTKGIEASTQAAIKNLEQQAQAQLNMARLEQDKKKTDEDQVNEYYSEYNDLLREIEDLKEELFSTMTGGIFDDLISSADDFVNAWIDAFNEFGDGLSGIEDSYEEMLKTLVVRTISTSIVTPFLNKWQKELEKYINVNDAEASMGELDAVADMMAEDAPEISRQIEEFLNALKRAGLDIMQDGGELDGLQKGIEGITEETALALQALLNSIRYFVSTISTTNMNIYRLFTETPEMSPIYQEMQLQTQYIRSINDLMMSMSAYSTNNGRAMKVMIV